MDTATDTVEQKPDGTWVASRGTIHVIGDTKELAESGLKRFLEKGLNQRFCHGCGQSHDYCICSSF